jgi:K+-sensing histidine kinase KdpD
MTELSLNILDIAQNSIKAEAKLIGIAVEISSAENTLTVLISDNGCGMTREQLEKVTDPFFTTRDTRSVGLGVPFFKDAAESTGGFFDIVSEPYIGTQVKAVFGLMHIDRAPLGDMNSTVETLIFYNTHIDFTYRYKVDGSEFTLDTREVKDLLDGAPIDTPEVKAFIREFLKENAAEVSQNRVF